MQIGVVSAFKVMTKLLIISGR